MFFLCFLVPNCKFSLLFVRKKNDEAEDKARVVMDDLMDEKIKTVVSGICSFY